jgi:hypothetical protein
MIQQDTRDCQTLQFATPVAGLGLEPLAIGTRDLTRLLGISIATPPKGK